MGAQISLIIYQKSNLISSMSIYYNIHQVGKSNEESSVTTTSSVWFVLNKADWSEALGSFNREENVVAVSTEI